MLRRLVRGSVALLLLCACGSRAASTAAAATGEPTRTTPLTTDLVGLSSLAVGQGGALFTLPERAPVLLELSPDGAEVRRSALVGAPDGLEFEALAWLGGQRFAIGTEGGCATGSERVLVATRDGDTVRVDRIVDVPMSTWGVACDGRRGIEGLCAASGQVVAALEATIEDGERVAPLVRIDVETGALAPFRLALTSTRAQGGKVSGLDCRDVSGALEVVAIERHFELSRVIGFTVPLSGAGEETPLRPRVLVDLAPYTNGGARNFEGLVRLDERRVLLISDNYYGRVTGPSELLEIPLDGVSPVLAE